MITDNSNKLYELVIYIRVDKGFDETPFITKETEKRLEDLERVLTEYYVYPVFRKKIIDKLSDKIPFDYVIKLKPGTELKYYKVYYLGPRQDEALKEYIKENLPKGFIRESQLLVAFPILFVPKKGTTKLRLIINYRRL